jgi:hypothetical protein
MKKILSVFITVAALLILVNASEWEGSAAASVGADFPEAGFFAATGSFPRNTVVDITNLENNKTIRVIITGGLENPGLLAVLSPEAAEAIGLQTRSIGRVRMSMAADSAALSRSSGSYSGSGDFDYDPVAMIAAAGISPEFFQEILAQELSGDGSFDEYFSPTPSLALEKDESEASNNLRSFFGEDYVVYQEITDEAPKEFPAGETVLAQDLVPGLAPELAQAQELVPENTAQTIVSASTEPQAPGYRSELENYEIRLVRADAMTPNGPQMEIDPRYIIAPIPPISTVQPQPEYFNQPIPQRQVQVQQPETVQSQQLPMQQPETVQQLPLVQQPEPSLVQPQTTQQPVAIYSPVPDVSSVGFSVPVKDNPETGYYVQVMAAQEASGIESEIHKIGNNMPLVVQPAVIEGKLIYRLLIGPVNLGESGALLQRYRLTYQDAFVLQYPRAANR